MKNAFALSGLMALAAVCLAGPAAAEGVLVAPLETTGDIPPAIAAGFRAHLRATVAQSAPVIAEATAATALAAPGAAPPCRTDACAEAAGQAAGARFVLSGAVDNTDEIYKVELALYDRAQKKRVATAEGLCELCAAEEVDRTIDATFARLRPALTAPAPVAAPPPDPDAGKIAVEITTTPDGADIALDGEPMGQAPIVLKVAPGTHTVRISKDGMQPVERTVSALDRTIKLAVRLNPAPTPPPVATPPPTPPPIVVPPVAAPTADDEDGGYLYTGAGMLVGGALLTAGGIWATLIDGDITCTDGLGVRECPTVYNTKGVGMTALGLGAGLIGAGVTLIIVDVLDDDAPAVTPTAAPAPGGAVMGLGGRF